MVRGPDVQATELPPITLRISSAFAETKVEKLVRSPTVPEVEFREYVTAYSGSTNFPTTPGAYQTTKRGNGTNAFVVTLNTTGTALVSSR